jgi:hypothetical protein
MYEQFEYMGISPCWQLKLIQGYAGQTDVFVEGKTMLITLISKRKIGQGGPEETGIDDNSDVSNTIETE